MSNQADEDQDDGNLNGHDQAVEVGDQIDAAQVQQRHDGHQTEDEVGRGNTGKQRRQVDLGQQHVDHRHEQIIEQRGPTHHEADVGIERLLRIGVGRSGRREAMHQSAIAQRGEQHANQRQQVGGGHMADRHLGDDAKGIKHRHRGQISQPHHHDLPQAQALAQAGPLHAR